MRAVIQRVSEASVVVDGKVIGQIGKGLLVLLGVADDDTNDDVKLMAEKVIGLRCFSDDDGKFNLSLIDIGGSVLAISQFTLLGDCRKGRRPSFSKAARPGPATELYEAFVQRLRQRGVPVETGEFGAHMEVKLTNDGPVTLMIDTRKVF